jgi:hypothetical protein
MRWFHSQYIFLRIAQLGFELRLRYSHPHLWDNSCASLNSTRDNLLIRSTRFHTCRVFQFTNTVRVSIWLMCCYLAGMNIRVLSLLLMDHINTYFTPRLSIREINWQKLVSIFPEPIIVNLYNDAVSPSLVL